MASFGHITAAKAVTDGPGEQEFGPFRRSRRPIAHEAATSYAALPHTRSTQH
jgi:hypothetical protein